MRVLLDTNIVYDIMCQRPYDREGLEQLKIMHAFGDVELWVSAKSFTDLFYLLRKEVGSETAHDALDDIFSWAHACDVGEEDVKQALQARWFDFEDSLVNVCAEKVKADFIVTRDEKGFRGSSIPHGSSSAFMDFVFQKTNVRYAMEAE